MEAAEGVAACWERHLGAGWGLAAGAGWGAEQKEGHMEGEVWGQGWWQDSWQVLAAAGTPRRRVVGGAGVVAAA